jgi:Tfp pilus assembly protein PilO
MLNRIGISHKKPFNSREKLLFILTAAVIVTLVASQMYAYVRSMLKKLDGDISRAEYDLMVLKNTLAQSNDLSGEYEKMVKGTRTAKDTDTLLQNIETIARTMNVSLLSIKPGVVESEGPYKTFTIKIESQENVAAFTRFLYTLTEDLRSISINRMQIQMKPTDPVPRIQLSVSTVAFKE